MKRVIGLLLTITMFATMLIGVPFTAQAEGAIVVTMGDISAVDNGTYYTVSVPYTVENWVEGTQLAVIAYDVTNIADPESTNLGDGTLLGYIDQMPTADNDVFEFFVDKGTSSGTVASFNRNSTMLVKIGSTNAVTPAVGTFSFSSVPVADYKTILTINPADFAKVAGSGGGGTNGNVKTEATIDGTVVKLNTIANAASSAGHWATSKYSNIGLLTAYELPTEGAPFTTSDAKVIFAHRGDVNWGGDLASPASGIDVTPIYGGNEVKVGDEIRITAWVYADDIVEYGTKTLIEDQTTPVDVRMWAYDPWVSNSDPGYNTKATVDGISLNTTMVSDQWTELVLEYTVTEENKGVTNICIDNKTDEGNPYPLDFYFGGLIIEKAGVDEEVEPTAAPTPDPTPEPERPVYKSLLTINPTDFAKIEGSGGAGTVGNVKTEATINGTNVKLYTIANGPSTAAGSWATSKWSNIGFLTAYELPTEGAPFTADGTKVIFAHRGDVKWGGDLANPASGIDVTPIYGGNEVKVGDEIRITAWVYADGIVEYGTKTEIADQTTPVDVRMWAYDPWVSNADPGYNTNATVDGISLNTKMVSDQWTELVLEYTVTEANKGVTNLCIDNKTDSPNPYPMDLYFAGLTIEKKVTPVVNNLVTIDATDFTKIAGSGGAGNNGNVQTQATIDGTVVNLNTIAHAPSSAGHWTAGKYSNLALLSAYGLPTEGVPAVDNAKVIFVNRGDVNWGGDIASPETGINITPIYGGKEVNVGDTIKITAYVYAEDIVEYGTKTLIEDQTTPVDVRMWAYDPWKSAAEPGYNTSATVADLSLHTTMVAGQWTKLELEYEITEENMVVTALSIDNKTAEGNPYPMDFYFAIANIEKIEYPGLAPEPVATPEPTAAPTATPAPTAAPTATPAPTAAPTATPAPEGAAVSYSFNGEGKVIVNTNVTIDRVYWGFTGDTEEKPVVNTYADLKAIQVKAGKTGKNVADGQNFNLERKGWYTFVAQYTDPATGAKVELCDSFYVPVAAPKPTLTQLTDFPKQVTLNIPETEAVEKVYYAMTGTDVRPEIRTYNDYLAAILNDTGRSTTKMENGTTFEMKLDGYYTFVIRYYSSRLETINTIFYTYCSKDNTIPVFTQNYENIAEITMTSEDPLNKLYWAYMGTEKPEIKSYTDFTNSYVSDRKSTSSFKDVNTYVMTKEGWYSFVASYKSSLLNKTANKYASFENKKMPAIPSLTTEGAIVTVLSEETINRVDWAFAGATEPAITTSAEFTAAKNDGTLTNVAYDKSVASGDTFEMTEPGWYVFMINYNNTFLGKSRVKLINVYFEG